jgi:hypothetical protein
MMFVPDL